MVDKLNIDAKYVLSLCPQIGYESGVIVSTETRRKAFMDVVALHLLHVGGLGTRNGMAEVYYDVREAMARGAFEASTRAEQTVRVAMYSRTDKVGYHRRPIPQEVSKTARKFVSFVDALVNKGFSYPSAARDALSQLVKITYPTIIPGGVFTALERGLSQEERDVIKRNAVLTTVFLHALIQVYKPSENKILDYLKLGLTVRTDSDRRLRTYAQSLMESSARKSFQRRLKDLKLSDIAEAVSIAIIDEMRIKANNGTYGIVPLKSLPVYLEIPRIKK